MFIGELAKKTGVPVKTIRYYEEIGVLPKARRITSGYRDYDLDTVERLRFIRASQQSGLTLGEIRGIIEFRDHGESPCTHVLALLQRKVADMDEQIRELERARDIVVGLVSRARGLHAKDCDPLSVCHLIP